MLRQFRWWRRIASDASPIPLVNENLAVGWFSSEAPSDPLADGNGFVMHATGAENGELWARSGNAMLPAVRSVQNVQIHYVVVLRDRGAIYYASSVAGANGLGGYPNMRPLAIDAFNDDAEVYAGIHQAALGQIGFRLDTRIYGARVADITEWDAWFGTAQAADELLGAGELAATATDVGGRWQTVAGQFERTPAGTVATREGSLAIVRPASPSGLVHVVVDAKNGEGDSVSLVWRYTDPDNLWRMTLSAAGSELAVHENASVSRLAFDERIRLRTDRAQSLQVLDEGHRVSVFVDGALLFGQRFGDQRLTHAAGVGIASHAANGARFLRFEAHPRECRLPAALDQGAPWWRRGTQEVVTDRFDGPARDLEGKTTTTGGKVWRRIFGTGSIDVTGQDSAKFRATPDEPSPGRLIYAIDWDNPEFADLEIQITPPGTGPNQRQHGLCGFVLWQDPKNYVMLNIWRHESYGGASISTFFQLDGFEDLYDAIWANIGNRFLWGRQHSLRMTFDGMRYMAFVDEEPVMYRALTDVYPDARQLKIRRVGLLGNWEWGTDTGSVLHNFKARV
jgi:hypothetical protein